MTSLPWLPFRWEGSLLGDRYFPHAAMFLSGQLPTLDNLKGWFQFDLGAPTTVLYGQAFAPDQREYLESLPRFPHGVTLNGQEIPLLQTPLHIGPWHTERVAYLPNFGSTEELLDDQPILGTVGSDLVRDHLLILDFPGQRLARISTLPPDWEPQACWAPLRLSPRGHVLLQLTIDETPRWAMFDTGSSLFQLLTDPHQWQQLTTGEVTEVIPITAWGEVLEVKGGPARASFALGEQPLPITHIHYLNGEERHRFLQQHNLVGVLGNAPFLEVWLILDFPHGRVGILPTPPQAI